MDAVPTGGDFVPTNRRVIKTTQVSKIEKEEARRDALGVEKREEHG